MVCLCACSSRGQLWCVCVLAVVEVNCGVFVCLQQWRSTVVCLCACSSGGQLWCVCVLAVVEVNCGVFVCLQ